VLKQSPAKVLRWPAMVFACRALSIPLLELCLMIRVYGFRRGSELMCSFQSIFLVGSEISNACFIFYLMSNSSGRGTCDYAHPEKSTCKVLFHSAMFAVAVGLKWIHMVFEMMCIPGFGQTVLPAFYAVISKDALWFLFFLLTVLMGSFHSYWSLPIPDNMPTHSNSHLTRVFLKVFKLDILGDANMFDLEGVKEKVSITLNNSGTFSGGIDDGPESQLYHDAICILIVFLVTIVAILVMNVTIGIVGDAYEYNKTNANQLWCHYRAAYTIKLLLRWNFWKNSVFCRCTGTNTAVEANNEQGIFIGCHEVYFLDANDTQEVLQDLIDQEKEIEQMIEKLKVRLQQERQ